MKKVLLIGSTGFVGKAVFESLKQSGFDVCDSKLRLHESTDWSQELQSTHGIVNAGGVAHISKNELGAFKEQMEQANHRGLLALVRAFNECRTAKILINISSVAASGWSLSAEPIDEKQDLVPSTVYGRTKREGEALLLGQNNDDKLIVNLRPPLIIGEDAAGNFGKLQRLAAGSKWLPFGAVNNQRSLLSVRNLGEAIVHLLKLDETKMVGANSGNYFICDQQPVSLKQIIETLRHSTKPKQFPVPSGLLKIVLRPLLGRDGVNGLFGDLVFDASKFANHFDWHPEYDTILELRRIGELNYDK